jgi:hypothetical protein
MEQAKTRIHNALDELAPLSKRSLMLDDLAKAIINADELLSALSFMYDRLYDGNASLGIIGRRSNRLRRQKK